MRPLRTVEMRELKKKDRTEIMFKLSQVYSQPREFKLSLNIEDILLISAIVLLQMLTDQCLLYEDVAAAYPLTSEFSSQMAF